jgi:phosphoribosylglycinamide formyltransferase-1
VVVISDKPGIRALARAEVAGIPTRVVSWSGDRSEFTERLCDVVESAGAELMVLAGFMRILGESAVARFPGRIVNIHPSLLPAFPGAHAVEQALEYGVKSTGVTVHFVDEEVDHGPIIAQEAVPVEVDDDVDSLHARIQVVEHALFPRVVAACAEGRLTTRGRKVVWS